MDIPRLDAKGVAVELVNDAINCKHAFLTLGYAAATTDQDKAVREFLQGKDVFVSLPTGEGKSLCFATLLAVFDFLKQHLTVCTGSRTERYTYCTIGMATTPLCVLVTRGSVSEPATGLEDNQQTLSVPAL